MKLLMSSYKMVILLVAVTILLPMMFYGNPADAWTVRTAGPHVYVDPVLEWHEERNAKAIARGVTEPVLYPAFWINPINNVQCDIWTPITGNVPEFGILTWTIQSGEYFQYANLSHTSSFSLINYINLPCSEVKEYGQLNVTFMYNDPTDKEIAPDTKVKDLYIDRVFLHTEIPFTVSGFSLVQEDSNAN